MPSVHKLYCKNVILLLLVLYSNFCRRKENKTWHTNRSIDLFQCMSYDLCTNTHKRIYRVTWTWHLMEINQEKNKKKKFFSTSIFLACFSSVSFNEIFTMQTLVFKTLFHRRLWNEMHCNLFIGFYRKYFVVFYLSIIYIYVSYICIFMYLCVTAHVLY